MPTKDGTQEEERGRVCVMDSRSSHASCQQASFCVPHCHPTATPRWPQGGHCLPGGSRAQDAEGLAGPHGHALPHTGCQAFLAGASDPNCPGQVLPALPHPSCDPGQLGDAEDEATPWSFPASCPAKPQTPSFQQPDPATPRHLVLWSECPRLARAGLHLTDGENHSHCTCLRCVATKQTPPCRFGISFSFKNGQVSTA